MRAGGDAESGGVVGKSAPVAALADTLSGIVLAEGVVRTPEHAGLGGILGIRPRGTRADQHASFG